MEVTKRTYQKHKTDKKITVKHYLNTHIGEYNSEGEVIHPIYVQVTYNTKNTKFKSLMPNLFLTERDYNQYLKDHNSYMCTGIERDKDIITWLVRQRVDIEPDTYNIGDLPKRYHSRVYELSFFVEWALKEEIRSSLYDTATCDRQLKELPLRDPIRRSALEISNTFYIYEERSAHSNLEFYLMQYPHLGDLKKKYRSHVWFIGIYIDLMCKYIPLKKSSLSAKRTSLYNREYILPPNIEDFKYDIFQSSLRKVFNNISDINDLIHDCGRLWTKYYDVYTDKFLKSQPEEKKPIPHHEFFRNRNHLPWDADDFTSERDEY